MRKIAVLQLTLAVAAVAAFGVVPVADAAKKRGKEDGGDVRPTDEVGGNDVRQGGDSVRATGADEHDDSSRHPAAESSAAPAQQHAKQQSSKQQHNAKLLSRLGMKRIRTSGGGGGVGGGGAGGQASGGNGAANHHRKRLAGQSRSKYGGADGGGKGASDSQMFVVKLPPHSHFYDDGLPAAKHNANGNTKHAPYGGLNTVPVGFVSNGKPAKVYHWNLPTIKHALQQGGRYKGVNDVVVVQQQQPPPQHHHHHHHHQAQQQTPVHHQPQPYGQAADFEMPSVAAGSKIVPRRTLYYKPRASGKPVKKSFVNNGKPNGFYVVSSKNAAAAPQYHKIVKTYYGSGDD